MICFYLEWCYYRTVVWYGTMDRNIWLNHFKEKMTDWNLTIYKFNRNNFKDYSISFLLQGYNFTNLRWTLTQERLKLNKNSFLRLHPSKDLFKHGQSDIYISDIYLIRKSMLKIMWFVTGWVTLMFDSVCIQIWFLQIKRSRAETVWTEINRCREIATKIKYKNNNIKRHSHNVIKGCGQNSSRTRLSPSTTRLFQNNFAKSAQ